MKRLYVLLVAASVCFPSVGALAWWQSIQQVGIVTGGSLSCSYTPITTGTQGTAYTGATPSASGGTPAYTFTNSGSLPSGLTISSSTGVISGTPTANGSFPSIQVVVTDSLSNTANCGSSFTLVISPSGGSVIKMIQAGSCTIASSAASCTYTVSPTITNTANAMLVLGGYTTTNTGTGAEKNDAAVLVITNSSTITATRGTAPATALTVNFTIVEFVSGVNSIQAATISFPISTASKTATLGTAVGANAFVLLQGSNDSGALGSAFMQAGVTLTNSTTVTAFVTTSATITQNVRYMVVDLDSTVVSAIQQVANANTSTSTTDTDTITSVTPGNASLMWGGVVENAAATFSIDAYSAFLTNATTVTKTRTGNNATSRTVYYTVVTWASSALNGSIQRTSTALAMVSAASATWTLGTSVTVAKSFANWNGFSGANAGANVTAPSISLASGSTVTAALNAAGTSTPTAEVVQFQ